MKQQIIRFTTPSESQSSGEILLSGQQFSEDMIFRDVRKDLESETL